KENENSHLVCLVVCHKDTLICPGVRPEDPIYRPIMSIAIVWFRQDLRLHDNEALAEALRQAEAVIPVYVADPDLSRTGPNRLRFRREAVLDLRQRLRALGSELLIREGNAAEQLYRLALETKSNWVFCNRERTRDEVMQQDQLES